MAGGSEEGAAQRRSGPAGGQRVLLFTGKGGVGKTTTAAATALRCAEAGLRTVVMSSDPAHSLEDSFDTSLGPEPKEVASGCHAQQLDAQQRLESSWSELRDYLRDVLRWAGVDAIEAEELAVIPGLDEIFALTDMADHVGSGLWDVVIVDCGPTAETLRLLSLPELLGWYMERVFPVGQRVTRAVRPALNRLTNLPAPSDEVFDAAWRFHDRLSGVRAILADHATTSVRLVVNPERMVVAEARRTFTYLSLFGYRVDAVVANRLLPDSVADPWFDQWREVQRSQLRTIEESFAPVPVLRAPLAETEVVGVERLTALGAALYEGAEPHEPLYDGEVMSVRADGDGYVLSLPLPFATREEVKAARHGDDIIITVGPHRRSLLLPDALRRRRVTGAALDEGSLRIAFAGQSRSDADADERSHDLAGRRTARRRDERRERRGDGRFPSS